jgi:hypothetical protein
MISTLCSKFGDDVLEKSGLECTAGTAWGILLRENHSSISYCILDGRLNSLGDCFGGRHQELRWCNMLDFMLDVSIDKVLMHLP